MDEARRKTRILIVEDELVVAEAIRGYLEADGYEVTGVASKGFDAIRLVVETHPDLVLMDVRLGGIADGIDAAQAMRAALDVPIVYLTAYGDKETLSRASKTLPEGYLLKPFTADDLRASIEMALARHRVGKAVVHEGEGWLRGVVRSMDEAVLAVDREGLVSLLNPAAERLTGWMESQSLTRPVQEVLVLVEGPQRRPIGNPLLRAMQEDTTIYLVKNGTLLVAKDGTEHAICDSASPIRDKGGSVNGAVMVFRGAPSPLG